jgi:hypothetical protein
MNELHPIARTAFSLTVMSISPTFALGQTDATQPLDVRVEWTATRPSDDPEPTDDAGRNAEAVGRLVHARVDVAFEEVELRKALRQLGKSLGVNIVLYERVDEPIVKLRLDGKRDIDLTLQGVSGRVALETMLAMANREATWQVHGGIIEVGMRKDLARTDARVSRVYDVTDLSIDAPDFQSCGTPARRLSATEVASELVRMISTHCEPDAFLPPPRATKFEEDPQPTGRTPSATTEPSAPSREQASPTINLDPRRGTVFLEGQWATMQLHDEEIIVYAPDFVHRAIDGYPLILPPRVGAPSEKLDPLKKATGPTTVAK